LGKNINHYFARKRKRNAKGKTRNREKKFVPKSEERVILAKV